MKQLISWRNCVAGMLIVFLFSACGGSAETSGEREADASVAEGQKTEKTSSHTESHSPASATASSQEKAELRFDKMPGPGTKALCPIMKNEFEVTPETESTVYKGKTYVFCCPGCKQLFEKKPEKYAK